MGDAHAAAATTLSVLSSSVAASNSTDMGYKDVTTATEFNKHLRDDGKTRCGTARKLVCTCKGCPFFVRFKKRSTGELPWVIVAVHLFHEEHCTSVAKPKPRELVQLDVFKNAMAANPSISASKLAAVIQDESGMGAEASDAGCDSARKRKREGDAVDVVTESDSAATVEGDAHLINTPLEGMSRSAANECSPNGRSAVNGTGSTEGSTRRGPTNLSDSDGDADMDGENDRMTDDPQAQPPLPSLPVIQQQDEQEDISGGFTENILAVTSRSSNPEVEYLGSMTNVVDERTRLAEWHRIKQRLELVEIEMPANESCLYFAFHAILSSECDMRGITIEDETAMEDAEGYRERLSGFLLENFDELRKKGTITSSENTHDLHWSILAARVLSCTESAVGVLQIKAAVIECGHPITVFVVQSDGRVLACVYYQSHWNDPRAVVKSYVSASAALDFISCLKRNCVVPLVLVLYRLPSGDHFNALRLASQETYREWTCTETKRKHNERIAWEVVNDTLKHAMEDVLRDYE